MFVPTIARAFIDAKHEPLEGAETRQYDACIAWQLAKRRRHRSYHLKVKRMANMFSPPLMIGFALLLGACNDHVSDCSNDASKSTVLDLVAQYEADDYARQSAVVHANGGFEWAPTPAGKLESIITISHTDKLSSCEADASFVVPLDALAQATRKAMTCSSAPPTSNQDYKMQNIAVAVSYRTAATDDHQVVVSLTSVGASRYGD